MGRKYNIIYADPPWKFKTYSDKGSLHKSADCHYLCMEIENIMNLQVSAIAADDCVLFLWVTFPLLQEGMETIRRWGFEYKTCGFNWVKKNKKADTWFMGLGYWTRSNSEICLIGTKGKPKRINRSVSQICDARIMEHSRKPDEIRNRIVKLCGDVPRAELFARQKAEGWDSFGYEIDGMDIREVLKNLAEGENDHEQSVYGAGNL